MTVVRVSTITCDAGGESSTSTEDSAFGCSGPVRWASLEWEEDPKPGETHRQWKTLSLCPEHLNMMLALVGSECKKKIIEPPVTDAP